MWSNTKSNGFKFIWKPTFWVFSHFKYSKYSRILKYSSLHFTWIIISFWEGADNIWFVWTKKNSLNCAIPYVTLVHERLQNSIHEVNPFALFYYFPTIPTVKQKRTALFGCMAFHTKKYASENPFSYKVIMRHAFLLCSHCKHLLRPQRWANYRAPGLWMFGLYVNNYNNPFPEIKNRM